MSDGNAPESLRAEVAGQHEQVRITALSSEGSGYRRTAHPDAQWYAQAGLGLFFHWGISSVEGKADLSWGMMKRPDGFPGRQADAYGIYAAQTTMTPHDYWRQAEKFLCGNYDPDKWLAAARDAGIRYVVLTTKHHDGFCLWPSAFGEFNTRKYLGGRDLVGEFVASARKHGLKIGFYYSPPDWHFQQDHMSFRYGEAKPDLGVHHQPCELPALSPEQRAAHDAAYARHVSGHVTELLRRYGQIDILWFDGLMPPGAITLDEIRAIQPGILVNPRGYGYGDFNTPECCFPAQRFEPGWWEYCHVFADGAWGYLDHETYKPLGWLLGEYSKTRAWDGNFLPNVAPNSRGEMPENYYLRMRQLQEWMAHSSEAVVGTTGGQWPAEANVPVTRRDGKTYAHVDWLFDGEAVEVGDLPEPRSVRLLRTGDTVPYLFSQGKVSFRVPQSWRTNRTDIVVIE